jgi:hypothetical protein
MAKPKPPIRKSDYPRGLLMGRSLESVEDGGKEVADRWLKARRAMKAEDQVYAVLLAAMAKKHSSEAFYAFDDPMEAAIISVLVEIVKEMDDRKKFCLDSESRRPLTRY